DPDQSILLSVAALNECGASVLGTRALLAALANPCQCILEVPEKSGLLLAVAWSPDGRHIASGSEVGTTHIWDMKRRAQIRVWQAHEGSVNGVAWSPDGGRIATASGDGSIRVWDAKRATESLLLSGHHDSVRGVAWSPDGRYVASGSRDC